MWPSIQATLLVSCLAPLCCPGKPSLPNLKPQGTSPSFLLPTTPATKKDRLSQLAVGKLLPGVRG